MDTQENKTENQKNKITVFFKEHWVLLTICIFTLITVAFYFVNFWGTELSCKTDDWGDFGGYFGGIVGTILAFGAFMLMKETLEVQKKEFKNQLKIFNQQQFETTFFKLLDKIEQDKKITQQFYLKLLSIYNRINDYANCNEPKNQEKIKNNYNDLVKSYLDDLMLYNIFLDKKLTYHFDSENILFSNIKNIIETFSLFEYLNIGPYSKQNTWNTDKIIIGYYKISAFGKRNEDIIASYIMSLNDITKIEEYAKNDDIMYRLYAANNPNIPINMLIDTLHTVSFDENSYTKNTNILRYYFSALKNVDLYKNNSNIAEEYWYDIIQFCEICYCEFMNAQPFRYIIDNTLSWLLQQNNFNPQQNQIKSNITNYLVNILLNFMNKKELTVVPLLFLYRLFEKTNYDYGNIKETINKIFNQIFPYHNDKEKHLSRLSRLLHLTDEEYEKHLQEEKQSFDEMKPKLLKLIDDYQGQLTLQS